MQGTMNQEQACAVEKSLRNATPTNTGSDEYISDFQHPDNDDLFVIDIGCNVLIKSSAEIRKHLSGISSAVWTASEKNKHLSAINIPEESFFVSDIYKIYRLDDNKQKISKRCKCPLNLPKRFENRVQFCVAFHCKELTNEKVFCQYSAVVYNGDSWKLHSAELKDGSAQFTCLQVDSFGIICRPTVFKEVVSISGTKIEIGHGCGLSLVFDKDTVATDQDFIFTVQKPCQHLQHGGSAQIISFSHRVNFEYDKAKYTKGIKIVYDSSLLRTKYNLNDKIIKLICYKNDTPSVYSVKEVSDGLFCRTLKGCDSACFGWLRKGRDYDAKLLNLNEQLGVTYGFKTWCKILLFFDKKISRSLHLLSECCETSNLSHVMNKHTTAGRKLIYKSKNICLPTIQRIRIRPFCSIGTRPGSSCQFSFLFLSTAEENYLSFDVEITKRIGGTPNAILEFTTDDRKSVKIVEAEFNLDSLLFSITEEKSKRRVKFENKSLCEIPDNQALEPVLEDHTTVEKLTVKNMQNESQLCLDESEEALETVSSLIEEDIQVDNAYGSTNSVDISSYKVQYLEQNTERYEQ